MKKYIILLLILGCALPVFAKKRPEEVIITPMTQLEKRQYQTRTYNAEDKVVVMKALLNVLQDEGYIVYNVNSLLGFVYGVKDYNTSDRNVDISKEFGFTKSRLSYNGIKIATMETTANITEYGNNVRMRINFKRKLLNEYGNAQFIEDIEDAEFYDGFYIKVDNAIKLQKTAKKQIKQENTTTQKIEPVKENETIENKTEEQPVEPTLSTPEKSDENINKTEETDAKSETKPSEETLSEKELKKQEKALAKELAKIQKEQEKQAKLEAKKNKESEKIDE